MSEVLIKVENVSKKFCKDLKRSLWYGMTDIARSVMGGAPAENLREGEFWAVRDVSFEVRRGECLGLIGHNGAGKSTLLKMLNGLINPDEGRIEMHGKIGALIELGAGFNPILTGRENVYNNGAVLGFSKAEIDRKFDEIVAFAEIEDFIDMPVQNYSSGMKVRLGFAIASQMEIDILLIDEVLAVGDVNFQLKCFNKLGDLRKNGVAIIFVSHNLHHMTTFCTEGLVLDHGNVIHYGDVGVSIEKYKALFHKLHSEGEIEKVITGNKDFIVKDVFFKPAMDQNKILIDKEDLEVTITYEALIDFNKIEIDCLFRAPIATNVDFFQANNRTYGKEINIKAGSGSLSFKICDLNVNDITFNFFIAIWLEKRTECIFWWRNIPIKFLSTSLSNGIIRYDIEYKQE
ncbi:ABC transporter ATP-binding protein [Peijinzhouia sedimentorum]